MIDRKSGRVTGRNRNSSISVEEYNKLFKAYEELEELRIQKLLRPFVDKFMLSLGTLAAYTPYSKWPREFKLAFENARQGYPHEARKYLERMTKEVEEL